LRIQVRPSGTDEEALTKFKTVPEGSHPTTCPVRTLVAWLNAAKIAKGPLFRPVNRHDKVQPRRLTDQSVALIVKRAAARAGLDPGQVAPESLRQALSPLGAGGEQL
jgi:hypothetical protein